MTDAGAKGKLAIVGPDGLVIGWANTELGCCRQLARAHDDEVGHQFFRERLEEVEVDGHRILTCSVTLAGVPTRVTIEPAELIEEVDDVLAPMIPSGP